MRGAELSSTGKRNPQHRHMASIRQKWMEGRGDGSEWPPGEM